MKYLLTLFVLWQAWFTIPTHLVNGDTLTDYSRVRLYKHNQSPTWVAMHVAMQADTNVWAAFWPIVRAEADPIWVNNFITSPITLPDTLPLGYEYYLVVVRQNGLYSLPSNQIWR